MLDRVDYKALDSAKNAFIEAGKKTAGFAKSFGFMPVILAAPMFCFGFEVVYGAESLYMTLLPEGLGTADDAKPEDLSSEELVRFWRNIGEKRCRF